MKNYKKKIKIMVLTIIFIVFNLTLFASTVEHVYDFEIPQITEEQDGYHHISIKGLMSMGEPGKPEIPVRSVCLLLPPGEQAISVSVICGEKKELLGEYRIYPAQESYSTSYEGVVKFTEPDPNIYNYRNVFPEKVETEVYTQYLRGNSIGQLQISPIQYIPASGKIFYYAKIKVIVETKPTTEAFNSFSNLYRADENTKKRVKNIVHNFEQNSFLYPTNSNTNTRSGDHKLVIITSSSYTSRFNIYKTFKNRQGYNVLVKTTSSIYSGYSGVDNQDKIRKFIKDAYQNMGTEYILIGGDTNIVPCRKLFCYSNPTDGVVFAAADIYFVSLDRVGSGSGPDWNLDNDSRWGEYLESDYYAELTIGRISCNTGGEITSSLNKHKKYQESPVVNDLKKAIMVGQKLYNDPLTWGGTFEDEIKNGGTYNGYYTAGIPGNFTKETLYERDGSWQRLDLQNKMNAGTHLISHRGHANSGSVMKFQKSDVKGSNLTTDGTNHNYYIIYSTGCKSAKFDVDCVAERFLALYYGCVAYIGNSGFGRYVPGTTLGSAQFIKRQFYDALFREGITRIGEMLIDAKDEAFAKYKYNLYSWEDPTAHYSLNLLGDPTLDIWTNTPSNFSPSYPSSISTSTTRILVGTGNLDKYAIVGLSQNGNHIGSKEYHYSGYNYVYFDTQPSSGTMDIWISGHNRNIHKGTITVTGRGDEEAGEIEISEIPKEYSLSANTPNPFYAKAGNSTMIEYALPQAGKVMIEVYNVKGQLVNTLVNENKSEGYYNVAWNGKDNNGIKVGPGIYLYKAKIGNQIFIKKMVLMK